MVDWLKRGISGRFWYGNEPSGALVLGIYYLRSIIFSRGILFHGLYYYCMIDSQT
jgi:hypothetical protein